MKPSEVLYLAPGVDQEYAFSLSRTRMGGWVVAQRLKLGTAIPL